MVSVELFLWIGGIYSVILLFSWMIVFVTGNEDIHISWKGVTLYIPHTPRMLSSASRRWPKLWNIWFWLGSVFAVGGMILGALASVLHLGWLLSLSAVQRTQVTPVLVPIIPGVNMPLSDGLYYFTALLIAAVVHEAGHALCALTCRCAVDGMGVAVFFVVPAAFTEVRASDLELASRTTRIKVLGAGAWHNFVLCLAGLALVWALPVLLMPVYATGQGMHVVVQRGGGGGGAALPPPGAVITGLNGCRVRNEAEWRQCFSQMMGMTHQSFCVPSEALAANKDEHDCCEPNYKGGLQCFNQRSRMYCLSAKAAVLGGSCNLTHQPPCRPQTECVDASRTTIDERIIWISTASHDVYVMAGEPAWLWHSLTLSPFIPRFAPWLFGGGLEVKMSRLLGYIVSMSGALGLLNLLPIHFLDGSHILDALLMESLSASTLHHVKSVATLVLVTILILSILPPLL